MTGPSGAALRAALGRHGLPAQIRHITEIPARTARHEDWPEATPEALMRAFAARGVERPWAHQVQAAALAAAGRHTVLATGTASGKSLGYQLPVATALAADPRATALYLSPTKALAADQLAAWRALERDGATWLRAAPYDGDTAPQDRIWAREHANVLMTNPDMLHVGILPHHERWATFLRHLAFVVVDESHSYRGVFGSQVGILLRRLRRLTDHYRGDRPPAVFLGASATSAAPAAHFSTLIGDDAAAVTEDASPHGAVHVAFWEPELTDRHGGENGAPVRRSAMATAADLMTDLALQQVRTLAFIRSRRGAEAIASAARRQLEEVEPGLGTRIAAYRSGYLPEERRELEEALRTGRLLGMASTPALEMGIDVAGLDAVVVAGWPGTRASFLQQIGRAGRGGQEAVAFFVASDDPLDTYVVDHPEAVFDLGVEDTVLDPGNPHLLGPQLCAAAAELPLTPEDLSRFGDPERVRALVDVLVAQGLLRRRPAGWFWTHTEHAAALVSLRDDGGGPMDIIDAETGALLGTMGSPQAHYQAHPGAVYVHQDRTYLVEDLDEDAHAVIVQRAWPDFTTQARDVTEVAIEAVHRRLEDPGSSLSWCLGDVQVRTQVISFQRKALLSGEILGEEPLDLPARDLFTTAVWFQASSEELVAAGLTMDRLPGALHAAEHAMIGMMPLVASNDRWDIGGVSMVLHPDTGTPTVFVYDGRPGGAGFAERGFEQARRWVEATAGAIAACTCPEGCPSCVQSPKCGNRNSPLDKAGALTVLRFLISRADALTAAPTGTLTATPSD
ncbi:DEAD/DEAH box helicase [Micrococcus sp.]|uniref:DEAD/DEAH box helicase n=1 Tax=Micrococcus sp. TaxID=1271 RepID=UPI002A91663D|nr:DEAD/DEAH box helicase [Micrococcus sp.]MDY6055301.1 Zn-binding domain-containing protein [Micrococcus sp.]